jgi:hypothetical protein
LHSDDLREALGSVEGPSDKMPLKRQQSLIKRDLLIWLIFEIELSILGSKTTSSWIPLLTSNSKPIVYKVSNCTSKRWPLALVCSRHGDQWDFWSNIYTRDELQNDNSK